MKIMILSDSHSMTKQTLLQFIKNHPASYYIHCGDIYMPYTPLEVDHFYKLPNPQIVFSASVINGK